MLLQIVSHLKYIVNNKREAETFSAFESPDAARSRRASKEAFMPGETAKQSCAAMPVGGVSLSPTRRARPRAAGNAIPSGQRVPPGEAAKQSCAAMVRESVFRRRAVAGGGRRGTLLASGQMGFPGEATKQSAPPWLGNPSLAGAQGAAADGGAEGRVKGFCCTKSIAGERAFSPVRARCPFRRRVQSRDARKTGRRSRCPYTGKSSGPVPGAQAH